jgi:aminoglycoside phosphotransferase (APT) family kinase protein
VTTGGIVEGDAFDERLAEWLGNALDARGAVSLSMLDGPGQGSSATTLFVDAAVGGPAPRVEELVVRIQPTDKPLFLEADLTLPYRMMELLGARSSVPVPSVVGIEPDGDLLGAPFSVMSRTTGRVLKDVPPYNRTGWLTSLAPAQRRQVWTNGLDVLADVHRIDADDDFAFLAQPSRGEPGLDNYLQWVQDWYRWAIDGMDAPVLDAAMEVLLETCPTDAPIQIVWGDARPGNLLYAPDGPTVVGVFDWEMATLGPGEIDLGWWLFCDRFYSEGFGVPVLDGLPSRAESIAQYEYRLGRPVADLEYYDLLGAFRMAVILVRAVARQVGDALRGGAAPVSPATQIVAELVGAEVPALPAEYAAMIQAMMDSG